MASKAPQPTPLLRLGASCLAAWRSARAPHPGTSLLGRLPLSDKDLDLKDWIARRASQALLDLLTCCGTLQAANKILASAQTREKFLKIVQCPAPSLSSTPELTVTAVLQ